MKITIEGNLEEIKILLNTGTSSIEQKDAEIQQLKKVLLQQCPWYLRLIELKKKTNSFHLRIQELFCIVLCRHQNSSLVPKCLI